MNDTPESTLWCKSVKPGEPYYADGRESALLNFIENHPRHDAIRGSPEGVCAVIDEFCQHHQFLMNLGPRKSSVIQNLIRTHKPRVFIEYGGYVGYSAIRLSAELRRTWTSSSNNDNLSADFPTYYVLERDPGFANIIIKLTQLAGLSDVVKVIVGESSSSIHALKDGGSITSVDMVLFDHDESQYVADLQLLESLRLLRLGTIIIADNVLIPGAPEYLSHVDQGVLSGKYESRKVESYLPFGVPEPLEITTIIKL